MASAEPFAEALSFVGTKRIAPVTFDAHTGDLDSDAGLVSDRDDDGKLSRPSYPKDLSHIKVRGGKAAAPKPIRADYDDDDARIVELKQMGYNDNDVAARLIKEGRIRYDPRTIATRWRRIRKALEEKEDEMLDDELSDWHEGEDQVLKTCIDQVKEKLEKDVAVLRATMWRKVSVHFADVQMKKKYTAKACSDRWASILDGTALLPIELDSDKAGRARLREKRIEHNKALRAQAAADLQAIEDAKLAVKLAKVRASKKFHDDRAAAAERKERQAEIYRTMKASGVAARKRLQGNAKGWLDYNRVEIKWQRAKARAEAQLHENWSGGPARKSTKFVGESDIEDDNDADTEDEPEFEDHYAGQYVEVEATNNDNTLDDGEERDGTSKSGNTSSGKRVRFSSATPSSTPSSGRKSKKTKQTFITIGSAAVTDETLLNSRSILTRQELADVLSERKLAPPGDCETHPQIVARIAAEDQLLKMNNLKEWLSHYAITEKTLKTNAQRVRALEEHNAAESAAGQAGVKPTDLAFKQEYEGYQIVKMLASSPAADDQ